MAFFGEKQPAIKAALDLLQSDPEEATLKAQQALDQALAKSDRTLQFRARLALGIAKLQEGEASAAVGEARTVASSLPTSGESELRARTNRLMVTALIQEGSFEDAALAAAQAQKSPDTAVAACGEILSADVLAAQEDFAGALSAADGATAKLRSLQAKEEWVTYELLKLAEFYCNAWKAKEAISVSEDALALAKSCGDRSGEGCALQALAAARQTEEAYDQALEKVEESLAIFESLKDPAASATVLRTKVNVLIAAGRLSDAKAAAQATQELFKASGDAKGQAAALLLLAEVSLQAMHTDDAIKAAKEALSIFQTARSRAGQAAALSAIVAAGWDDEHSSEARQAAEAKVALYQDSSEARRSASALLSLANLLTSRIGKKITRCKIASTDDTVAALQAAKDAHAKFAFVGDVSGMESALRTTRQILLYNNVSADVVENLRDPSMIFEDVMAGKFADAKNALPKPNVQLSSKIEEVVPTARQLDRGRFAWNMPHSMFTYTMIWQPCKERTARNRKPRGNYDISTLMSGTKIQAAPILHQARSSDAADRSGDPLVVYMLSPDCKENMGSTIMSVVQTMGAMIVARVSRLVIVQLDECQFDFNDTSVRQCNMHPVVLGLIRSLRLEAPHVTAGFVSGDAASWLSKPEQMVESFFDVVECDESEVIYKRGDAYAPLLVHRQLDEPVNFVKPRKGLRATTPWRDTTAPTK